MKNEEVAIVYFSKNGHAPYMQVESNLGWLKQALDYIKTVYALTDFLEAMSERDQYVNISNYDVIQGREPPANSRAMTGVIVLGKKFFTRCYKKPK